MQTISGDQEGIINLLYQLRFIENYDEFVSEIVHDITSTGTVEYQVEEGNENDQIITLYGKGKRIHESFLAKIYTKKNCLKKINIQTASQEVFRESNFIRKRYVNCVDVEFHGHDFVDVKKSRQEYTLFCYPKFYEQITDHYSSIEAYKGTQQISKLDNSSLTTNTRSL